MKHELRFHRTAQEELEEWQRARPVTFKRIGELIKAIDQTPNYGIGKPKALQKRLERFFGREELRKKTGWSIA